MTVGVVFVILTRSCGPMEAAIVSGWEFVEVKQRSRKSSELRQDNGGSRALLATIAMTEILCCVLQTDET